MIQTTIAIVCDCDDTLAPDTTEQLLESLGINQKEFFEECAALVNDGHDPALAYMNQILLKSPNLTREKFNLLEKRLSFTLVYQVFSTNWKGKSKHYIGKKELSSGSSLFLEGLKTL